MSRRFYTSLDFTEIENLINYRWEKLAKAVERKDYNYIEDNIFDLRCLIEELNDAKAEADNND